MACPLLGTDGFVRFCNDRELGINRERLLRLERLGVFSPIFRVQTPDEDDAEEFSIPIPAENNWFDKGWAFDTTTIPACHGIPDDGNKSQEGYYSIFQIDWLRLVMAQTTLEVQLDAYLSPKNKTPKGGWKGWAEGWLKYANSSLEHAKRHEHRPAVAVLCQHISNRYYPKTQGDRRTIRVGSGGGSWDRWISINGNQWSWEEEVRRWDAKRVESLFELTPQKLRHAYETLAGSQSFLDPLQQWYPLVQFVSIAERKRLKGKALHAETLREGARMLRWLYQDLYGEELPPPNEVHGTVITHIPELKVRNDARRYLEFVVNQYGLNPQPKLVLIVEGASEKHLIHRVFDELFGFAPGQCGIELLVIHGVGNATGNRRTDRFRAILRLIDYLHHHQTLVYLVLDNENDSSRLKDEARRARSIHGSRNRITRPEYIRIWKASFEFDNFSDTELAAALSKVAEGNYKFSPMEVASCRRSRAQGADLGRLYKGATRHDIPKVGLSDVLTDIMLSPGSRRAIGNRPIVRVLQRVVKLAIQNPFPVMQEIWEKNQASKVLAKKK